eukprot:COSAG02_NODE_20_length_53673_cov_86.864841_2_plen_142_part_00
MTSQKFLVMTAHIATRGGARLIRTHMRPSEACGTRSGRLRCLWRRQYSRIVELAQHHGAPDCEHRSVLFGWVQEQCLPVLPGVADRCDTRTSQCEHAGGCDEKPAASARGASLEEQQHNAWSVAGCISCASVGTAAKLTVL